MKSLILFCVLMLVTGCAEKPENTVVPETEPEEIVIKTEPVQEILEPEVVAVETPEPQNIDPIPKPVTTKEPEVVAPEIQCLVFDDFEEPNRWAAVNDNVMGGRSLGYFEVEEGVLNFEGSINTNGGGFSSIRSRLSRNILSDYARVVLRIRGDGRRYEVTFRDENLPRITHRQGFVPLSDTEWQEVSIAFDDLTQAFFGRRVQSPPFDKDRAWEMGIILSDGQDGPFRLEVDSVLFCP